MEYHECDICGEIIHHNINYLMIKEKKLEEEKEQSSDDLYKTPGQLIGETLKGLRMYETCNGCKQVFDHLLSIRKEELVKIKEEVKKIEKKSNII